ncbi:MAG TPA: hypothetical protein VL024_03620 [Castellaniella sp.]|nr:hypothetical protein [Castellaniella sp.]
MKSGLRKLMWILWPSFLMAAATSALVFALIDPQDVIFLDHVRGSRQLVYSLGFFVFWAMAALSSALTLKIAPQAVEVDEFGEPVQ